MTHPNPDDLSQTLPLRSGEPAGSPPEATLAVPRPIGPEKVADGSTTLPHGARPEKLAAAREHGASALRIVVLVPGYDILCANQHAVIVWRMLTQAGAYPVGAETFNILRIEAGTPIEGLDFDENYLVMEFVEGLPNR